MSVDGVSPALDSLAVDAPGAVYLLRGGRQTVVTLNDVDIDVEHLDEGGLVCAPMHGKLLVLLVAAGDHVNKGQRVAVIEAMKMEHSLLAPTRGRVVQVAAAAGAQIAQGARIMVIEPNGEPG